MIALKNENRPQNKKGLKKLVLINYVNIAKIKSKAFLQIIRKILKINSYNIYQY